MLYKQRLMKYYYIIMYVYIFLHVCIICMYVISMYISITGLAAL